LLQFVFEAAPFVRGAQLIDDRKAGGFDPAPDDVFSALLVLAVDESGQIFDVRPGLPGCLLGQFVVLADRHGPLPDPPGVSRRLSNHCTPFLRLRSHQSGAQARTVRGRAFSTLLANLTPVSPLTLTAIATTGVN